jgi:hypothetical protein
MWEDVTVVRPRVHGQELIDCLRDLSDLVRGTVMLGACRRAASALATANFRSGGAFEGLVPGFTQGVIPRRGRCASSASQKPPMP